MKTLYGCYAFLTGPCLRVNTVPVYWEANKRAKGSQVHAQVGRRIISTVSISNQHSRQRLVKRPS